MRKLSNLIYDIIQNNLDLNEERADALTQEAIRAMEAHLEKGA